MFQIPVERPAALVLNDLKYLMCCCHLFKLHRRPLSLLTDTHSTCSILCAFVPADRRRWNVLDPHLLSSFSKTEYRVARGGRQGAACAYETAAPVQSHAAPTDAPACPHLCGHFFSYKGGWSLRQLSCSAAFHRGSTDNSNETDPWAKSQDTRAWAEILSSTECVFSLLIKLFSWLLMLRALR